MKMKEEYDTTSNSYVYNRARKWYLPVGRYNEITKKFEEVVNPRGMAYATRNRLKFRKRNTREKN